MKKLTFNLKRNLVLLFPILILFFLVSCEKDPYQEINYLQVPFIIDSFKVNNTLFTLDDKDKHLEIEEKQTNRSVGFILKDHIEENSIDKLELELSLPIDPKRYDVDFHTVKAAIKTNDNNWDEQLKIEKTESYKNQNIEYLKYKIIIDNFTEEVNKENFRYYTLELQSTYKEKKRKKKEEPRTIHIMIYAKS